MKTIYKNIGFVLIGIINGLIFTLATIVLINSYLLNLQITEQIKIVLEKLYLFISFFKNTPLGNFFKNEINKQFNDDKSLIPPTKEDINDYNKKFYKFIIPIGVVLFIFIIITIIYIVYIHIKFSTKTKLTNFLVDWVLEVFVTLLLIGFLFLFVIYITNKYILANVGRIFLSKKYLQNK